MAKIWTHFYTKKTWKIYPIYTITLGSMKNMNILPHLYQYMEYEKHENSTPSLNLQYREYEKHENPTPISVPSI